MEITWYGLSCFRLSERGAAAVVTDPFPRAGLPRSKKLEADIVTLCHHVPGSPYLESIKDKPYLITGPGEYEVGGVFITGIHTGANQASDPNEPYETGNTLYVFDFDAVKVVHLGELGRLPTQSELEAMGNVNVALVPIGGGRSLNPARAAEVVSMLEPNIVIPMHCAASDEGQIPLDALNKFLKEMGISEIETQAALKVNRSTLPEETQVVVLEEQRE